MILEDEGRVKETRDKVIKKAGNEEVSVVKAIW